MYLTNGFSSQLVKVAGSTLLLGVGAIYVVKRWIDNRSPKPSGQWEEVGVVTALMVYPIKSCKGISLEEGNATSIGIETIPQPGTMPLGDRRFVVYKQAVMEMVSARTHHQMLQVEIEAVTEKHVVLKYKQGNVIKIEIPMSKADRKIKLWTEDVALVDCGDEVASWLQRVVYDGKEGFRLGFYPDPNSRRNIPHLVKMYKEFYPFLRNEFTGAFSDLSSFLVLNESSVEDLNSRIKVGDRYLAFLSDFIEMVLEPLMPKELPADENHEKRIESVPSADENKPNLPNVSCTNFRGNIIMKGPQPYEEDKWEWVKIGDQIVFRYFKPCTRCSLTTVNPDNSVRDKNLEPITTLKTYRLLDEERRKLDVSPAMGIYVGLWSPSGKIKVGDRVYVCK